MKGYLTIIMLWTFWVTLCNSDIVSHELRGLIDLEDSLFKKAFNMYNTFFNDILRNPLMEIKLFNKFPDDFLIGCSTSAYQIEGAYNEDGKGENIWDYYTNTRPYIIKDRSNADISCNSYYKYKEDVRLIKNIGLNVYRFSISWSRVLPNGMDDMINEAGVQYYQNLIDELLEHGIEPLVTLYHLDIPEKLVNIGGWLNPKMPDYFEKYVRVVFDRFGNKVKLWITMNEPKDITSGYGGSTYPPFLNYHGVGEYLAGHLLLKAHARAYHVYDKEFRKKQNGKIGITLNSPFFYPKTDSKADHEAAERTLQFVTGWFAHPIFSKEGDYPPIMRNVIDENSAREGRNSSRLPRFTLEEINALKGSADFFGLNHYSSLLATFGNIGEIPSFEHDLGVVFSDDPRWLGSSSKFIKIVPEGFRAVLNWLKREYNNPTIIVTENGYPDSGALEDYARIYYYQGYINELLKAIYNDHCKVKGFIAWGLMDDFEFLNGYTLKFGLYHVDFSDKNRTRTEKRSVKYFQFLTKTRSVPDINLLSLR